MNRREFLKTAAAAAGTAALASCMGGGRAEPAKRKGEMEMRVNPRTGERVSLLGYGCMRFPTLDGDKNGPVDQEQVNRLIDYALEHGVNYFDTSPAYHQGHSETVTGNALSRHPRDSYFIATKMSNFSGDTWSREASIAMFENSLKALKTDYVDYLLLHAVGGGEDPMATLYGRFFDNGICDWLAEQREKGRIRNLGFSFHGHIDVFEHLLGMHDKYHWDFVQIQLNYIDWRRGQGDESMRNVNAEYLYNRLEELNIPAVIMEPLLGGTLGSLPDHIARVVLAKRPEESLASWAFRFAGTPRGVLTVLSGMTYMDHLVDNLKTYCGFEPISEEEAQLLMRVADMYLSHDTVPCTGCQYCMPCPHGLDIPGIFRHYNKCLTSGDVIDDHHDPDYMRARRSFLAGYDVAVDPKRQADHCIACGACMVHCPQEIRIPERLAEIDKFVERLKTTEG